MFDVKDIERARGIVSNLDLPEEFGSYENDDEFTNELIIGQLEDVIDGDFSVTNGASKLVIIIDDLPFVIKIPFNGHWYWEDSYDDDEDGYEGNYFCYFSLANGAYGECDDYCGVELNATRAVEEAGFGYFVPGMMYLTTVCGHNIYVQEKVKPLCECRRSITPSHESLEKANKTRAPFVDEWLALVFDKYGEEAYKNFMDWAYECEPDVISDCHSGNYGIDMNGNPVLFDISGFRD